MSRSGKHVGIKEKLSFIVVSVLSSTDPMGRYHLMAFTGLIPGQPVIACRQ